jgi:hypothetical protein
LIEISKFIELNIKISHAGFWRFDSSQKEGGLSLFMLQGMLRAYSNGGEEISAFWLQT